MSNKENKELKFIYNSKKIQDREALAYAKSLKHYSINEFDVMRNTFTERQLGELADRLNIPIKELIDTTSKEYTEFLDNADMDEHDLLEVIKQNPNLIRTPIIEGTRSSVIIKSAKDIIKEDMDFKVLDDAIEAVI